MARLTARRRTFRPPPRPWTMPRCGPSPQHSGHAHRRGTIYNMPVTWLVKCVYTLLKYRCKCCGVYVKQAVYEEVCAAVAGFGKCEWCFCAYFLFYQSDLFSFFGIRENILFPSTPPREAASLKLSQLSTSPPPPDRTTL